MQNSKYVEDLMLLYLYIRKHADVRKGKHMLDVARRNLFKSEEGVQPSEDEVSKIRALTGPGGLGSANEETLKYLRDILAAEKSRSVMELCRAGVKFRKAEDETIPLSSIRFENNGVITIPAIPLHELSEVQCCNS